MIRTFVRSRHDQSFCRQAMMNKPMIRSTNRYTFARTLELVTATVGKCFEVGKNEERLSMISRHELL